MTGLIVAIDTPDLVAAEFLAKQVAGGVDAFKVGLTLWVAHGPEALLAVGQHGPVFCDLKFHDIPHQVGGAAAQLASKGVWMLTVHASGGAEMVKAAVAAAGDAIVAGVTELTSREASSERVVGLALEAAAAGASAIVCSAWETKAIRDALGDQVLIVNPGIRPGGSSAGDQARVASPQFAARAGADYVVIGRPVAGADDPAAVVKDIRERLNV